MSEGRRGWRPVCQACNQDRKPQDVTDLAGLQFCKTCLMKALERIPSLQKAPKGDE